MPTRTWKELLAEAKWVADAFEGAHGEPYVVPCPVTGREIYIEAWVWNDFTGNQDPIVLAQNEPRIKAILIELNGYDSDWPLISSAIRILMERARGGCSTTPGERCTG